MHGELLIPEYSRNIVVDSDKCTVRSTNFSSSISQTFESLRRSNFVNEMTIDVDKGIAFPGVYDVIVKDLVIKSPRSGYRSRHYGGAEWRPANS